MRHLAIAIAFVLCGALSGTAQADVLDGLIFGIKCAGSDDPEECKARSMREADESRERLHHGGTVTTSEGPASAAGAWGRSETRGEGIRRNWAENAACEAIDLDSKDSVDVAYGKAMSTYSFLTSGEVAGQQDRGFAIHSAGYLHSTTPGALYRLEQVVTSPSVANGARQFKLKLQIRGRKTGSRISGSYCVSRDDPAGWANLQPKVRDSLIATF